MKENLWNHVASHGYNVAYARNGGSQLPIWGTWNNFVMTYLNPQKLYSNPK